MPPKKKTNKPNEEPADKTTVKEEKPLVPPQQVKPQPKKEEPKAQIKNVIQPTIPPQTQQPKVQQTLSVVQNQESKPKKIEFQLPSIKSSEDILQERRKKFGGEEYTSQQKWQQIKQERLKKFGTPGLVDQPEILEKRKEKFGLVGAPQDEEIIKKRLQKFGNTGEQEKKDLIEARKKKFGQNEQIVDLDQQIKKTKGIKKHEKHHHQPHSHVGKGDRHNFHRR